MQPKDQAALAEKIATVVLDLAEEDRGLSRSRLAERIAALLTEEGVTRDHPYQQMMRAVFSGAGGRI